MRSASLISATRTSSTKETSILRTLVSWPSDWPKILSRVGLCKLLIAAICSTPSINEATTGPKVSLTSFKDSLSSRTARYKTAATKVSSLTCNVVNISAISRPVRKQSTSCVAQISSLLLAWSRTFWASSHACCNTPASDSSTTFFRPAIHA